MPAGRAANALAILLAGTSSPAVSENTGSVSFEAQTIGSPNPFLQAGSDRGAILTEIAVKPDLILSNALGSRLDLSGTVQSKWFSRQYGHYIVGDAAAVGTWRKNEYLSVDTHLSFSHDLSIDELTSSTDSSVEPRSLRTDYQAGVAVKWHPDAYSEIRPMFDFEDVRYTDSIILKGTRSYRIGLLASRHISAHMELGLRAEALFGKVVGSPSARTRGLYATLKWLITEHWSLSGQIGTERSNDRIERLPDTSVNQAARSTLNGKAELCRTLMHGAACASVSASNDISGVGGLQRTVSGLATIDERLSNRTTMRTVAEYRRSSTQGGSYPAATALRVSATVEQRLGRSVTMSGIVQYLRRQSTSGEWIGAGFGGLRFSAKLGSP